MFGGNPKFLKPENLPKPITHDRYSPPKMPIKTSALCYIHYSPALWDKGILEFDLHNKFTIDTTFRTAGQYLCVYTQNNVL